MTRVIEGMEIEQNLVSISGTAEIDDDLVGLLKKDRTITLTLKAHFKGANREVGGQNTSPREIFRLQLDAIDSLEDGGQMSGQLAIGDPADPDDAE